MARLTDIVTLEAIAPDRFSAPGGRGGWESLFGGQLIAQALNAASRTVTPDRFANSLHAYFLRAGAFDVPILFDVERERDGAGFSSRRVVGTQGGKPILSLIASFSVDETGPSRDSDRMPDVPAPEGLAPAKDAKGQFENGAPEQSPLASLDVRPIEGCQPFAPTRSPPTGMMWFRIPESEGADRALSRALLAYVSDLFLIGTALQPHIGDIGRGGRMASLDHALWFHEDCPAGDWMLYVQESPWAGNGRGLCRGTIFTREGRHVATIAQEVLMRI